jgi:hypothetical protein
VRLAETPTITAVLFRIYSLKQDSKKLYAGTNTYYKRGTTLAISEGAGV